MILKLLLLIILILPAVNLFAGPLEGGFALAPRASASPEEKAQVYISARLSVIEAAKKYEGVPYRYGGMTAAGLDCSGFIGISFRDAIGTSLPRSASGLYTWTVRIPLEKAQPGDLLFFRTSTSGSITHVGLYLGNRRFIHSASAGAETGVIYSTLDEPYWARAFAGSGRAFPEAAPFSIDSRTSGSAVLASANITGSETSGRPVNLPSETIPSAGAHSEDSGKGRLLFGAALAPIWNGFVRDGEIIRGISTQVFIYADTYSIGPRMVFGFEIRPEYDGALGVFRLPFTFSWGPNEKIRIFAGPVLSFGDASISTSDGERHYSGGTSWLGAAGLTAAPFEFNTKSGIFAPYLELAWQSYSSDSSDVDIASDFSAGFRFSTGVRWLMQIR